MREDRFRPDHPSRETQIPSPKVLLMLRRWGIEERPVLIAQSAPVVPGDIPPVPQAPEPTRRKNTQHRRERHPIACREYMNVEHSQQRVETRGTTTPLPHLQRALHT